MPIKICRQDFNIFLAFILNEPKELPIGSLQEPSITDHILIKNPNGMTNAIFIAKF